MNGFNVGLGFESEPQSKLQVDLGLASLGFRGMRMASSNTFFRPFCVNAEHSFNNKKTKK